MKSPLVRILIGVIAFAVFGLLFAYDVWEGIGNFVGVENQAAQLHLGITPLGWFIMYADVFLPALVWLALVIAFVIAAIRRAMRGENVLLWRFVVMLTLGLVVTGVLTADFVLGVPVGAIFDTGVAR